MTQEVNLFLTVISKNFIGLLYYKEAKLQRTKIKQVKMHKAQTFDRRGA